MSSTAEIKQEELTSNVYEEDIRNGIEKTEVLTETAKTSIKSVNYTWTLNYVVSRLEDVTKIQVFANFDSRYSFSDKVSLKVLVEAGTAKITEQFDLEKIKEQCFTIDLTKHGAAQVKNEDIRVTCTVSTTDIKYCAEHVGTIAAFTSSLRPHDVVLTAGNKKLFVHKLYLATWSKYFNNLFYGDYVEKNQTELKLKEIDFDELLTLLEIIYPDMRTRINDTNVLYLLKLADRFDMPSVMAMCGNHLMNFLNNKDLSMIDRLILSDKYNLTQLQFSSIMELAFVGVDVSNKLVNMLKDTKIKYSDLLATHNLITKEVFETVCARFDHVCFFNVMLPIGEIVIDEVLCPALKQASIQFISTRLNMLKDQPTEMRRRFPVVRLTNRVLEALSSNIPTERFAIPCLITDFTVEGVKKLLQELASMMNSVKFYDLGVMKMDQMEAAEKFLHQLRANPKFIAEIKEHEHWKEFLICEPDNINQFCLVFYVMRTNFYDDSDSDEGTDEENEPGESDIESETSDENNSEGALEDKQVD